MKLEAAASGKTFAWFAVAAEFWMMAVLVVFFVIRVLGSNTAQNFLRKLGGH